MASSFRVDNKCVQIYKQCCKEVFVFEIIVPLAKIIELALLEDVHLGFYLFSSK